MKRTIEEHRRRSTNAPADERDCRVVFSQPRFRQEIARERKRAERGDRAMLVLLIEPHTPDAQGGEIALAALADVLHGMKSDIETVGWYETNTTLGLIAPDLQPSEVDACSARLERSLREALAIDEHHDTAVEKLWLRWCIYPEPCESDHDLQDADPIFYPDFQTNRVARGSYHLLKRAGDLLLSLLLAVLLSPLLLLLALVVKCTSPGPVIFRQVRVGRMMRPFRMWKFRTMYVNADHGVHHSYVSWFIKSSDEAQKSEQAAVFKLTNDRRITPIGRILRRTSLDELPQLWNVVIGEMALVGPRPPLPYELQQYKLWHRHRVLEAKPGITGLWQVVGRSRTTFDEMVRLDLRYVRTMTLRGDIKILLATPRAVIMGKGAC